MKNKNFLTWMKNKKMITSVICIACIGTLCMGCGGSKDTTNNNTQPNTETEILAEDTQTDTELQETETTLVAKLEETETTENPTNQENTESTQQTETQTNSETENNKTTNDNKTNNSNSNTDSNKTTNNNSNKTENKNETTKKNDKTNTNTKTNKNQSSDKKEEKTEPSKPVHTHSWVAVTETVHHEAEYKTVHHDAVVENQPYTEEVMVKPEWTEQVRSEYATWCKTCYNNTGEWFNITAYSRELGIDINEAYDLHSSYHTAKGEVCQDVSKSILLDEIYHPAEYETRTVDNYVTVSEAYDEQVLVRDAWDETITTGYRCECGATK